MKAREKLKRFKAEVEHYRFAGEERRRWKDAVLGWHEAAARNVRPGTLKRYRCSLKQIRPIMGDVYVDEVDRKVISRIARRQGVSNSTRRRDLTAVSSVLDWCVHEAWVEENVARAYDRRGIKERRDPIVLPLDRDIDTVVADCPGNFAALVRWAQYTGMRQEECGSLERPQVDLKRRASDLPNSKTNRPRSVPLDDRAVGTYDGTVPSLHSSWVFHHGGERYLNISSRFCAIVNRIRAREEKEHGRALTRRFRFHDLRHWYAVDYLRRGGSIYRLQLILGHASIKTTEIYLDYLTPEEQEAAKRAPAQMPAQG